MRYIKQSFCVSLFLLASCQTEIIETNQEILGGQPVLLGDFNTVVALVDTQGGLCTATLIAPSVVLTAAHCVDPVLFGGGFDEADVARATRIVLDDTDAFNSVFGNGNGTVIGASKTVKNPLFNINNLGNNDIGLVFLKKPVTDRDPSPVEQNNNRNLVGTIITQVGYGISTQNPNAGTEIFVNKVISSCAQLGIGSDAELVCYDQTDGSGKCGGDSGGPSFDAQGKIVGITSFGDQDCVFFGADTRVSGTSELKFLKDTIAANLDVACAADGFDFDLCPVDGDRAPSDDDGLCTPGLDHKGDKDCARFAGCDGASVAQETTSKPFVLLLLSFFAGVFTLRNRKRS